MSVFPILSTIYKYKKPNDLVLLDNAHAHLAHLMFTDPKHAEEKIKKYGIHCERRSGCDSCGGSLGHNGGIGIGLAILDRSRDIYVIFSDGSVQEGTFYEVMRIKQELKLTNMKCYFNLNKYTAVREIDRVKLAEKIKYLCPDAQIRYTHNTKEFDGVQGHYKTL